MYIQNIQFKKFNKKKLYNKFGNVNKRFHFRFYCKFNLKNIYQYFLEPIEFFIFLKRKVSLCSICYLFVIYLLSICDIKIFIKKRTLGL